MIQIGRVLSVSWRCIPFIFPVFAAWPPATPNRLRPPLYFQAPARQNPLSKASISTVAFYGKDQLLFGTSRAFLGAFFRSYTRNMPSEVMSNLDTAVKLAAQIFTLYGNILRPWMHKYLDCDAKLGLPRNLVARTG